MAITQAQLEAAIAADPLAAEIIVGTGSDEETMAMDEAVHLAEAFSVAATLFKVRAAINANPLADFVVVDGTQVRMPMPDAKEREQRLAGRLARLQGRRRLFSSLNLGDPNG